MKKSTAIAIFFHEKEISDLFSRLVSALGGEAETLKSAIELRSYKNVVTEPCFHRTLTKSQQAHALIVGDPEALQNIPGKTLSRPLSEETLVGTLQSFVAEAL